jgi:NAD(P)-dependent dehydrogenase (short-subunit alcohol dehydrogenase family)
MLFSWEGAAMNASGRLAGRAAIITGAAAGIGEGIGRRFAAEGARVVLADVDFERAARIAADIGPSASAFRCDVSRREDVEGLVRDALERYGPVHILVNNAAAYRGDGHLSAVAEETWDRILAVNLKGPWLCIRSVVPHMRQHGSGSIVNIGSVNGSFGLSLAAYSASKGGLAALTRVAAIELGASGIRVNTICPGTIMTPNSSAIYADHPGMEEAVRCMYPLRRLGEITDIAGAALYLASDESKFVTGTILAVDGGLTAGREFPLNYVEEPR